MDPQDFAPKATKSSIAPQIPHYYGNYVRRLFLISGAFILLVLPFFNEVLPIPVLLTALIVILLIVFAAMTNPFQRWVASANVGISGIAVLIFEYLTVIGYTDETLIIFTVRQILALTFFFALYYSAKTLRAMLLNQIRDQESS